MGVANACSGPILPSRKRQRRPTQHVASGPGTPGWWAPNQARKEPQRKCDEPGVPGPTDSSRAGRSLALFEVALLGFIEAPFAFNKGDYRFLPSRKRQRRPTQHDASGPGTPGSRRSQEKPSTPAWNLVFLALINRRKLAVAHASGSVGIGHLSKKRNS